MILQKDSKDSIKIILLKMLIEFRYLEEKQIITEFIEFRSFTEKDIINILEKN